MAKGALLLLFLGVALQDVQAGTRKPTDPPNSTPAAEQGADLWAQTYRPSQRQQPTLHLSAQPTGGTATANSAAQEEHPTASPQQTGEHTAAADLQQPPATTAAEICGPQPHTPRGPEPAGPQEPVPRHRPRGQTPTRQPSQPTADVQQQSQGQQQPLYQHQGTAAAAAGQPPPQQAQGPQRLAVGQPAQPLPTATTGLPPQQAAQCQQHPHL